MWAAALTARPPANATWARFSLKRAEQEEEYFVEFKTDWDPDESVRRQRRGMFDAMVQAIKQLTSGQATFEMAKKRWLLRGGPTAVRELAVAFCSLGFSFGAGELDKFLASGPPAAEARAADVWKNTQVDHDEEAELGALLQSGWFREMEAQAVRQAQTAAATVWSSRPPVPATAPVPRPALGPGAVVQITGVTSHPFLNGMLGTVVSQYDVGRWLVMVGTSQYALADDKLLPPGTLTPHVSWPGQPSSGESDVPGERPAASSTSCATTQPIASPTLERPVASAEASVTPAPPTVESSQEEDPATRVVKRRRLQRKTPAARRAEVEVTPPSQGDSRLAETSVASEAQASATGDLSSVTEPAARSDSPAAQEDAAPSEIGADAANDAATAPEVAQLEVAASQVVEVSESATAVGNEIADGEASAATEVEVTAVNETAEVNDPAAADEVAASEVTAAGENASGSRPSKGNDAAAKENSQAPSLPAATTGGMPECSICMDAAVATVFVPCGHMAACKECGDRLAKKPCPVCRKKIKKVQRFFAV
eukprot:TRINITY_DN8204_c0_g1_i2.p1 TRINITY_DN8204_c0_g1~~TRINITY_DN8204_c0_g1_i2.p1  ORF type:complete len:541 (+),score=132.92 TRINITY_DN8204_c0_g1_i2:86-1708(+)